MNSLSFCGRAVAFANKKAQGWPSLGLELIKLILIVRSPIAPIALPPGGGALATRRLETDRLACRCSPAIVDMAVDRLGSRVNFITWVRLYADVAKTACPAGE